MPEPNKPTLNCGQCGYGVRGISELKCPECGADLTVVGIVSGSGRTNIVLGCVTVFAYSALVLLLSVALGVALGYFLPTYRDTNAHLSLQPNSKAYAEVMVHAEMVIVNPSNAPKSSSGFSMKSLPSPASGTSVAMAHKGAKMNVDTLSLELMPSGSSGIITTYVPKFRIDANTRKATWINAQGMAQSSKAAVTQGDVLDYFTQHGVDTTRADVQDEVKTLYDMLEGLMDGDTHFTLNGLDDGGYGMGSSHSIGPPWFIPVYILAWIIIWIVGMILLVRRVVKPKK